MKKLLFLFVFTVMTGFCAMAQNTLMATLNHEGEVSVFYGVNAIKLANDAAVDGDIISLTGGTFKATTLTKAVTLRGTGVYPNEDAQTIATRITDDFYINIADTEHQLVIEGINFLNAFYNKCNIQNPLFRKCIFRTVYLSGAYSSTSLTSGTFINCYISELRSNLYYDCYQCTMSLINCFVNNIYENNGSPYNVYTCVNSIIGLKTGSSTNDISYSSFDNCIFFGKESDCGKLGISNNANNCVATGPGMEHIFDNFLVGGNTVVEDISAIFKDFDGTSYTDVSTFELTDEAARTYLCVDGSQVGIHGGSCPLDFVMPALRFTKCVVANKSTSDGKLSVDIEVEGIK